MYRTQAYYANYSVFPEHFWVSYNYNNFHNGVASSVELVLMARIKLKLTF